MTLYQNHSGRFESLSFEILGMTTAATVHALNCDIMVTIMDYLYLLSLLERIVDAYDNDCISATGTYSSEFRSLIGDIKDILSNVE